MILTAIRKGWPWIKHLYADSAYDRASSWTRPPILDFVIEVVRGIEGAMQLVRRRRR
jgi:hypothetical protein